MVSYFDILFVIAIALTLFYLYLSWNFNYWKKRGVACDDKLSIIFGSTGDAFLGKKSMGEVLYELYKKHPGEKIVGWFRFRTPSILIKDPELIHRALVPDFHSFRNNDVEIDSDADPIMSKNIFVLKDEAWKQSRALITPAFTSGKIKAIYPIMLQVAKDFIQYLEKHPEEHHVKHLMSRYTTEIVSRCALGIEGNSFKEAKPKMYELGKQIFEPSTAKSLKMITFFALPKLAKILKLKIVSDEVLKFFNGVLRDVIVYRQENNIERNDLVQYLIEVKRKSLEVAKGNIQSELINKVYSDEDILSGCIMFFVEGYETSSLVLNNIFYYLAIHKDVQEKLREEVDKTLKEGEITYETLHELNYLNAVFLETNRILPVSYYLQKVCTEKYEMDIGKGKPIVIEKGTPVVLLHYGVQHDPVYWEEPELFKPERFLNKEEAAAKTKGIFLPFGDGPRICPGSRIATTLIKLCVFQIVAKLEILRTSKTPDKIDPDPNYFIIGHKGGIFLRFVERSR